MRCWLGVGLAAALLAIAVSLRAKPAEITVSGMGLIRDHTIRSTLIVLLGKQRGETVNAAAIEDASLILFSTLVLTIMLTGTVWIMANLALRMAMPAQP